jgi:hypothetical protein
MMPFKSVFKREVARFEDNGFLMFWERSVLPRKTKVYAVDYAGRDFAVTANGEKIRNRTESFLKSA